MLREQFKYITRKGPALALGASLSSLIGFLVFVTFNHLGSVGGSGFYTYIMTVISLTGITALSGMNAAIMVAAAQNKKHILRTASRRRVRFSFLLGCPVLLATGWVMLRFPQYTLAGYACLILLPLFPFVNSFTGIYPYLNGLCQFGLLALAQIGAALVMLAGVFASLRWCPDYGFLPPIAALSLKTLFEFGLYAALVRRDHIALLDQDAHLLSYGMKATLTGVTGNFESNADKFIVGTIFHLENLGMYSAGRSVNLALKQIPQLYYWLYAPKLAQRSPAESWRLSNRALLLGALALLPLFGAIFWALPWFYATFLDKFDQSAMYARWFVVIVAAGIPFYFYGTLFQAQRQARRELAVRATRTILIVLGLITLIPLYGIMGIIYAEILATAVMSLHSWYEARKSRGAK